MRGRRRPCTGLAGLVEGGKEIGCVEKGVGGETYGAIAARGVGVAFFEMFGAAVEDAWTPAAETAWFVGICE